MGQAVGALRQLAAEPDWEPPMTADWIKELTRDLRDPASFKAGGLRERAGVWEEFFKLTGNTSRSAQQVVRWVRDGIFCQMVEVEHPGQKAAPFHKKKVEIVSSMLKRALPPGTEVNNFLTGDRPRRVHFPNHQSTEKYGSFTQEELAGMLAKGLIKEWAAEEPPVVVNGLRVVDDKAPKLRLCLNPMYPNLFFRYQPVQYERLSEIPHLAEVGDFAFSTDDKSGYWQCALHPAMWKYLAFQFEGRVYCFTHLPFGVAPACYVYTLIKQEIYRPLRDMGLRMVALIDDQLSMQKGEARTAFQCDAMCRLLESLGWYLSLPKCQLAPTQLALFLGMLVDLKERAFRIPEGKAKALVGLVGELSSDSAVTDRGIAKLAGKVMALGPALELAPLMARSFMKAMQGKTRWDQVYPSPAALKADMRLLVELMKRSAGVGKRWALRPVAIRVVGDASEIALAAFTPDGELATPIIVPFTTEEREAVASNLWSSTARELSVLGKVLYTLGEQLPGLLVGKRIQYYTDSQPGMQGIMGMKGNEHTFPIVRRVRLLCDDMDTQLEVLWRPRNDAEQQQADDFTKVVDNTDWSLQEEVYEGVVNHGCLEGRKPSLDVFASPTNSKVPGAYFSLYLGPGCKGIDAFLQRWDTEEAAGARHLAWINGPFDRMAQILRAVKDQRVDCIIIAPAWPRPWAALWSTLPVRAVVTLPHRRDLLVPGSLVAVERRQPKAPKYKIQAFYVLWP
jgi:hypothetical protein